MTGAHALLKEMLQKGKKSGVPALMRGDDVVKSLRVFREIGFVPDDGDAHWAIPCIWRHTK
jgi:hypothetical protein